MNLLKNIFSPSCLIASLLLLIYTYYKSEIYWNGVLSNYYLIYYIVSILLVVFSILTFFLNPRTKEYLIISLISIVIGLYIYEAYLTFRENPEKVRFYKEQYYKKETGKPYDTRQRSEIYDDLRKVNKKVTVNARYQNDKLYALSGIANSTTILCNENGYYAIYESDRYGFNNPDKEWSQQEIEYLLTGDSFTHGACVNRPNDIASVLRSLSNKSVLNLGSTGSGPLGEYATLREYLGPNVKKVLWLYYEGNDLNDLYPYELENIILKNYLNDLTFTQHLKVKQNEINHLTNIEINKARETAKELAGEIARERFRLELIEFIKIYKVRILLRQPLPVEPQPEFKKILQLAKDITTANDAKLYFIYLPEYRRYKIDYDNGSYSSVKKIVNELDIPFIDIHTQIFEKEENPLKLFPFESYGHYNEEGYKKVAEAIYKSTKD